jgi:integrase
MTIKAILKGVIDQNGHQPIQIQISQGQKRNYFPTRIKVNPDLFINGRISSKHPKAKEWNQQIEAHIIRCQHAALTKPQKVTKMEFYTFLEKLIPTLDRDPATKRYYNSQIKKLKDFRPSFYTSDINREFLDSYKQFLKDRGNAGNTLWSAFKFLKKFTTEALKQDLIEKDPFLSYEFPKYVEPVKQYLTEAEVQKLDKFLQGNIGAQATEAGTWFLIACYTGLRISDLKTFTPKNILGDRLVVRTQKTKEMVGLPVSDRLKGYFERVRHKKLSMHENTYNKLIKIVAAAAGIEKHISSHTARHTAAMMLANAGVSQEVVAKILGHKDLRSTATYYKITNKRIDSEMLKIH